MTRIAIVIGSTRPGRRGTAVARWVEEAAGRHPAVKAGEATVEIVDVADFGLPLLDEAAPAAFGQYSNEHTKKWSEAIASYDGFVFVTPEYNRSVPGALKNAIDFLYNEWQNKAAGFVSYGVQGGVRAVEHLRLTLAEVKVADVATQVGLQIFTDFTFEDPTNPMDPGAVTPGPHQEPTLNKMLDEVFAWAGALKPLRETAAA
ncbi:NAD(P)H-dependent oxidoreductase [Streptomyces sp. NPDC002825]|uniref:NADPH-dependent FMN reductase n=1 Tax=Streptomyces sp. NPDC002825 TaxID=3154666 RepID=UPI00332E5959